MARLKTRDYRAVRLELALRAPRVGDTVAWFIGFRVSLEWTGCHFGGLRPWLVCPACRRRCGVLYQATDAHPRCRHCLNLRYQSQSETAETRAFHRYHKVRVKLRWSPGTLTGEKPLRMHWKTFKRLKAEHDRQLSAAWVAAIRALKGGNSR